MQVLVAVGLGVFFVALYLSAIILALRDVARTELSDLERVAWFVGVVMFPVIGALLWFLIAPAYRKSLPVAGRTLSVPRNRKTTR